MTSLTRLRVWETIGWMTGASLAVAGGLVGGVETDGRIVLAGVIGGFGGLAVGGLSYLKRMDRYAARG